MTMIPVGWIERVVRFLIGLPLATAYFYVRHFDMRWAYGFLAMGLFFLVLGLAGHHSGSQARKAQPDKNTATNPAGHYAHA